MDMGTAAVLPFGKDAGKWNAADVEGAYFGKSWLAGMTSLICKKDERTRPTRIVFTSGLEGDRYLGNSFDARHDQTGARLGYYTVVGFVEYDSEGEVLREAGDVPDMKLAQSTFK